MKAVRRRRGELVEGRLPRDSSEMLALLLSRGLLCAERDDHAMGRPLVYQPTPRLLQQLGAETLEGVKGRMGYRP